MLLKLKTQTGYVPAEENESEDAPLGTIAKKVFDAILSGKLVISISFSI